jgi:hypothetical protein
MFTTGSKYFYGVGLLALVGAFFYAIATSDTAVGMDSLTGALSLGYKGGVGDHIGYGILVAIAGGSFFAGGVLTAVRDADPEATAALVGSPDPLPVAVPAGVNHWPIVAAFGAAITVLGLIESSALFMLGLLVCALAALEWTVRAWSDRATDDTVANRTLRNRVMNPVEIPLFSIIGIALFVFAISRVLLAVSEMGTYFVFAGVPTVIFIVAVVLNARPSWSRNLVTGLIVGGAVIILAAGVVGLVSGPREIEHKEPASHPFVLKGTSLGPSAGPLSEGPPR